MKIWAKSECWKFVLVSSCFLFTKWKNFKTWLKNQNKKKISSSDDGQLIPKKF